MSTEEVPVEAPVEPPIEEAAQPVLAVEEEGEYDSSFRLKTVSTDSPPKTSGKARRTSILLAGLNKEEVLRESLSSATVPDDASVDSKETKKPKRTFKNLFGLLGGKKEKAPATRNTDTTNESTSTQDGGAVAAALLSAAVPPAEDSLPTGISELTVTEDSLRVSELSSGFDETAPSPLPRSSESPKPEGMNTPTDIASPASPLAPISPVQISTPAAVGGVRRKSMHRVMSARNNTQTRERQESTSSLASNSAEDAATDRRPSLNKLALKRAIANKEGAASPGPASPAAATAVAGAAAAAGAGAGAASPSASAPVAEEVVERAATPVSKVVLWATVDAVEEEEALPAAPEEPEAPTTAPALPEAVEEVTTAVQESAEVDTEQPEEQGMDAVEEPKAPEQEEEAQKEEPSTEDADQQPEELPEPTPTEAEPQAVEEPEPVAEEPVLTVVQAPDGRRLSIRSVTPGAPPPPLPPMPPLPQVDDTVTVVHAKDGRRMSIKSITPGAPPPPPPPEPVQGGQGDGGQTE